MDRVKIENGSNMYVILGLPGAGTLPTAEIWEDGVMTRRASLEDVGVVRGAAQQADCLTQFLAAAAAMGGGMAGMFAGPTPVGYAGFVAVLYGVAEFDNWMASDCPDSLWDYIENMWDSFTDWWCGEIGLWC
ncbi:MAG TPA: hypothetical protein VFN22_01445 [Gemmatimonadales bacterium]|nr:hypothetical protein [Gemmatimonadales bacterium]